MSRRRSLPPPALPSGRPPRRVYSPEQRREAVSRVLAGESRLAVAAALGMPQTCVSRWTTEHNLIAAGRTSAALSHTARVEPLITVWEGEERGAAAKIHYLLDRVGDPAIPIHDQPRLDSVARAAEVAHNAHLDYRDGRKGAEVHIDQRSITLRPLERLSLAELQALVAGGPLPVGLEAGPEATG